MVFLRAQHEPAAKASAAISSPVRILKQNKKTSSSILQMGVICIVLFASSEPLEINDALILFHLPSSCGTPGKETNQRPRKGNF